MSGNLQFSHLTSYLLTGVSNKRLPSRMSIRLTEQHIETNRILFSVIEFCGALLSCAITHNGQYIKRMRVRNHITVNRRWNKFTCRIEDGKMNQHMIYIPMLASVLLPVHLINK